MNIQVRNCCCNGSLKSNAWNRAAARTANYARFEHLIEQYVMLLAEESRAERQAGFKKKTSRRTFSSHRRKKYSS
jgi:hypothetical protein